MILPLPLIWKVQLPMVRTLQLLLLIVQSTKLSLTALFALGFLVIGATIASGYMGAQKDFVSGANFVIWCNVSLTATAIVAWAPQLRTLFYRRLRKASRDHVRDGPSTNLDLSSPSIVIEPSTRTPTACPTNKRPTNHRPLILSDKFLSGDGQVSIVNANARVGGQQVTPRRSNEG